MSMRVGEGGGEFMQEVIIFRFDMIIFVFAYIEYVSSFFSLSTLSAEKLESRIYIIFLGMILCSL